MEATIAVMQPMIVKSLVMFFINNHPFVRLMRRGYNKFYVSVLVILSYPTFSEMSNLFRVHGRFVDNTFETRYDIVYGEKPLYMRVYNKLPTGEKENRVLKI